MAELFKDLPGALANSVEIAKRCNVTLTLGKPQLPNFPTPGMTIDEFLVAEPEGPGRAPRAAVSGPGQAREGAAALRSAPGVREQHHHQDEVPGLLPDRGGVHPVGQEQRRADRPGPRFGRGLAGGLCAEDHRPRSAEVQPAVRALPESGTRLDARLRHRLLPGKARTRHPAREGPVRPRRGLADRHLRYHGGQGRDPRRRPRARFRLQLLRRHLEADSVQAGQAGLDRRGDRRRADAQGAPRRTRKRSSSCSTWRSRSRASPATSACTPAAC
jgi:hypothetical protein